MAGKKESDRSSLEQKAAAGCLTVFVLAIIIGIAVAFPEAAYFTAGLFAASLYRKAMKWSAGRSGQRGEGEEEAGERSSEDLGESLWFLSEQGRYSILLTAIRDDLKVKNTKVVRRLLAEMPVKVTEDVRTPDGKGPGVHKTDIPGPVGEYPSPTTGDPFSAPVGAGQSTDTDTDDTSSEGAQKGLSILIERPNDGMTIYRDPVETVARRSRVAPRKLRH